MFLPAVGLPRDQLIQAMGMLFLVSTLALALALGGNDFLSLELGLISIAGLVPPIAGMLLGQRLRRRLPEQRFRQVFFVALMLLGLYIVAGALGELAVLSLSRRASIGRATG